jgi:ankyrin repeat protein
VELVRALVKAGANVKATNQFGTSALTEAAIVGSTAVIDALLQAGADANARGVVRQWERKVITEPRPKDMNKGGFTPLLYAAREGCVDCVKALIAAGADLDL